jgi:uncharacterized protein YaaR (DUF327 family)
VKEYERKLQDLSEELHANKADKLNLQDKVGGCGLKLIWVWSQV